ncbi:Protein required for ethanol metabolism, partial [Ascosphaera atra]
VLFGTGDALAQQAVERKGWDKHDVSRTARMAVYGGVVFGPAATLWYRVLERKVRLSTTPRTVAARVCADQVVFAPTHMCVFLSSMAVLEGKDPRERIRSAFVKGYTANLALWPAVQAVNFRFTPLEHRVMVVNLVSLGEYSFGGGGCLLCECVSV